MKNVREMGPFSYPLVGQGSRRSCYRMPGGGLCVKFYHDLDRLPKRTRLSAFLEVFSARFFRAINVNAQEWRYHRSLRKRLTPDLLSVFPEHVELAYSEARGWGIIESLITNPDGTPARRLHKELPRVTDPALRLRLYRAAEALLSQIVQQRVKFYDMPNLLLQWTGEQAFRLRIADFEPYSRRAWAWLTCCGLLSQCKVRRRAHRYLACLHRSVFAGDRPEAATEAAPAAPGKRIAVRPFVQSFARRAGLI